MANIARSSLVMASGTFISRILGMIRSPFLLGAVVAITSPAGNAFDIANRLPSLIYVVLAGGLINAVLVPALVRANEENDDGGAAFINKLLTFTLVVIGAITVLLTLCAPIIVRIYAATMSPEWYKLTVLFAYWCLPQVFFYSLYAVLGQILNARENFGPYMWAPVANNIVAITGLIVMLAIWGPYGSDAAVASQWMGARAAVLGGFSTFGIIVQALILIIPLHREGIHFRPDFHWRGSGLGSAGKASGWVIALTFFQMIPDIVISNIAASATDRAVTAGQDVTHVAGNFTYTTGYLILTLPNSIVTVSLVTAVFTRLSRAYIKKDGKAFRADVSFMIRTLGVFSFFATAVIFSLAEPIARVIVPSATATEVVTLGQVITLFSFGIFGFSMTTVLFRSFYAMEDTRTPFFIGATYFIGISIADLAAYWLPPAAIVPVMIAIGIVAALVQDAVAYLRLSQRLRSLNHGDLLSPLVRSLIAACLTGAVGRVAAQWSETAIRTHWIYSVFTCIILGIGLSALFALFCIILHIEEIYPAFSLAIRVLRTILPARFAQHLPDDSEDDSPRNPDSPSHNPHSASMRRQALRPGAHSSRWPTEAPNRAPKYHKR